MSVSSMANRAITRKKVVPPKPQVEEKGIIVPKGFVEKEVSGFGLGDTVKTLGVGGDEGAGAGGGGQTENKVTQALDIIMTYIPTEVLTLYVATIAAIQTRGETPSLAQWITLIVFLAATPLVVWLIFAAKFMAATKRLPWHFREWPKWEILSAVIAFATWAYALPNTPFAQFSWYSSSVAGILVMGVAALLGLLSPLIPGAAAAEPAPE